MLIRHRDRISEVVDIVKGTFCFNPKDARAGPPAAAPWELLSHSGRPSHFPQFSSASRFAAGAGCI